MGDKLLDLEIVTPDKVVVKEKVSFIKAPAGLGSIGILANHAPLLTSLDIGIVEYTKDSQKTEVTISEGFLEVLNNKVTILVNSAEKVANIDLNRALAAKERAEKRLSGNSHNIDNDRAKLALKRAINRISAKHSK